MCHLCTLRGIAFVCDISSQTTQACAPILCDTFALAIVALVVIELALASWIFQCRSEAVFRRFVTKTVEVAHAFASATPVPIALDFAEGWFSYLFVCDISSKTTQSCASVLGYTFALAIVPLVVVEFALASWILQCRSEAILRCAVAEAVEITDRKSTRLNSSHR